MSTIEQELILLNQTKQNIKQAIINKGVSVLDSDTFASYADKITSITSGSTTNQVFCVNNGKIVDGKESILSFEGNTVSFDATNFQATLANGTSFTLDSINSVDLTTLIESDVYTNNYIVYVNPQGETSIKPLRYGLYRSREQVTKIQFWKDDIGSIYNLTETGSNWSELLRTLNDHTSTAPYPRWQEQYVQRGCTIDFDIAKNISGVYFRVWFDVDNIAAYTDRQCSQYKVEFFSGATKLAEEYFDTPTADLGTVYTFDTAQVYENVTQVKVWMWTRVGGGSSYISTGHFDFFGTPMSPFNHVWLQDNLNATWNSYYVENGTPTEFNYVPIGQVNVSNKAVIGVETYKFNERLL